MAYNVHSRNHVTCTFVETHHLIYEVLGRIHNFFQRLSKITLPAPIAGGEGGCVHEQALRQQKGRKRGGGGGGGGGNKKLDIDKGLFSLISGKKGSPAYAPITINILLLF